MPGFVGDDGVPVPGSDLVAACDAIVPSMVERDPEWAGWCAVLVNVNDLCAMGAVPVGLLDAVAARDASFAARVLSGLRSGAAAYGVPVLGGHTQLGVPAGLAVTALGRVPGPAPGGGEPVPGGGGRPGHEVRLTVDLGGGWRSRTNQAADLSSDRWVHRFNLFDQVRALENQVIWLSANQSGTFGSLRFVASAKVVGPGGEILAATGLTDGMAIAELDVRAELAAARRSMGHLRNRRPEAYSLA